MSNFQPGDTVKMNAWGLKQLLLGPFQSPDPYTAKVIKIHPHRPDSFYLEWITGGYGDSRISYPIEYFEVIEDPVKVHTTRLSFDLYRYLRV